MKINARTAIVSTSLIAVVATSGIIVSQNMSPAATPVITTSAQEKTVATTPPAAPNKGSQTEAAQPDTVPAQADMTAGSGTKTDSGSRAPAPGTQSRQSGTVLASAPVAQKPAAPASPAVVTTPVVSTPEAPAVIVPAIPVPVETAPQPSFEVTLLEDEASAYPAFGPYPYHRLFVPVSIVADEGYALRYDGEMRCDFIEIPALNYGVTCSVDRKESEDLTTLVIKFNDNSAVGDYLVRVTITENGVEKSAHYAFPLVEVASTETV